MSDRIGDYRDPFWSARDRRIRKAHLDAMVAGRRARDTDAEIARKRREEHAKARAERLDALAEELGRTKARLIIELAAVTSPWRDGWVRQVESIDLRSASALDELTELRKEVEFHQRVYTYTPQLRDVLPELTLSPVLLRFQREEEDRAARARDAVAELDPVLSRLADVVDAVQRYRSA